MYWIFLAMGSREAEAEGAGEEESEDVAVTWPAAFNTRASFTVGLLWLGETFNWASREKSML